MSSAGLSVPGPISPWRPLFGALSPAGTRARLSILMLHRVRPARDELFPNEMHAATFRERMGWVSEWFNVLPLAEAVVRLARGALPARALCITFDDGYADNVTVAMPILRERALPATFFIATAFLDGGMMWNDAVIEAIRAVPGPSVDLSRFGLGTCPVTTPEGRRATIDRLIGAFKYLPPAERASRVDELTAMLGVRRPSDLMMTSGQVRELVRAGMGIGGHTATHPILARLDAAAARDEIAGGRETLEDLVRQPIELFAYPNGRPDTDYGSAHVQMVKAMGFRAAVSTAPGAARAADSLFELPRFTPWGRTRRRWGLHLARNLRARAPRMAQ